MRLLHRLALATVMVGGAVSAGLVLIDAHSRQAAAEATLADLGRSRMDEANGERACERLDTPAVRPPPPHRPARHRPPPPGPRVEPPRIIPLGPSAWPAWAAARGWERPPVAADWSAVQTGLLSSSVAVVVETPWPRGPCARLLVTGSTAPGFLGALLPGSPVWLAPLLAVILTAWIALAPVARRIEGLTALVEARPAESFQLPAGFAGSDEVSALGQALQRMSDRLREELHGREAQERRLREFVAHTMHDVMVPLTVLMQHVSKLREAQPDQPSVRAIADEAHYIGALLQNLEAAARIEGGAPELCKAPVELCELVRRVAARHDVFAHERSVELAVGLPERPAFIEGDLTLLERALSNLVYNAIHYNRPGGHVAVVLEMGAHFVLSVLDDGPGIPADEMGQLVQRGFRGNQARSRGSRGHGLGLHITHEVAKMHGFELRLERPPEGGLRALIEGPSNQRSPRELRKGIH